MMRLFEDQLNLLFQSYDMYLNGWTKPERDRTSVYSQTTWVVPDSLSLSPPRRAESLNKNKLSPAFCNFSSGIPTWMRGKWHAELWAALRLLTTSPMKQLQ